MALYDWQWEMVGILEKIFHKFTESEENFLCKFFPMSILLIPDVMLLTNVVEVL